MGWRDAKPGQTVPMPPPLQSITILWLGASPLLQTASFSHRDLHLEYMDLAIWYEKRPKLAQTAGIVLY